MTPYRCFVIGLVLAASPAMAQTPGEPYWLIGQITGSWEYRDSPAGQARELAGKYDYLLPGGEVRCLEVDVRKCELRYLSNPRSEATVKLPIPIRQSGQWVRLKGLPPPPPAVLSTTATGLVQKLTSHTRQGGTRAASGCGGSFPLWAPGCGENIDLSAFSIQWEPLSEDSTGKLLVTVERVDGVSTFFRDAPPASTGEYSSAKLTDFLRKLQSPNAAVDVVVTVKADEERKAVRLVHIPPLARTKVYESRLKQVLSPDPVVRGVAVISLALDEGMWSRAGEEASRLMDLVSGSPPLLEYAMAGLCQSGFDGAKGEARKAGSEDLYNRTCAAPPVRPAKAPEAVVPAPPPAAVAAPAGEPKPVAGPPRPNSRTGVALLIGNSEYWNTPLTSVKKDLQGMKEALENLGFSVTVRENLRRPQEFTDALSKTLAEEKATIDDILLVYYSGHCVQIDGKSYLLGTGVSATARVVDDTKEHAQSSEGLLVEMEKADPATRILIIEACRDSFSGSGCIGGRCGFALTEEIPNTFVMFANKPGLPTPARSDYGLMGPFTEGLIYALNNSSGEIQDVYRVAATKTREFSPGQEPDEHHSRTVDPIMLRPRDPAVQDKRAKDLLNGAEPLYRQRAWGEFLATVERGKVLASNPDLQQRFAREAEFARLAAGAEAAEDQHKWADAADKWQKAGDIFPARQWATMKAAVEWLLAGQVQPGVRSLAILSSQPEGEAAAKAKQMLADLLKAYPALGTEAGKAAQGVAKVAGVEYELIKHEE